jgi:3-oxoacyl-(acyl-carrier-protein) synthase
MKTQDVYITGVGFYTPLGYGKDKTLYMLRNGKSGLKNQKLSDNQKSYFMGTLPDINFDEYINWKEAFRPTQYSQRFILGCLDAITDAQLQKEHLQQVGCIMETDLGPSESVDDYLRLLLTMRKGIISPMKFTYTVSNTALGDASRYFQLKGPSSILLTESSVSYAYDLIREGEADIIVCCAIDVLTTEVIRYKEHNGILHNSALDIKVQALDFADRYDAWSSGCCAVVLESGMSIARRKVRPYVQLVECFEHPTEYTPKIKGEETMIKRNCLKSFTGDMFYASTLFGIAANSLALYYDEAYQVGENCYKTSCQTAIINSLRDGNINSKFIIKKIENK